MIDLMLFVAGIVAFFRCGKLLVKIVNRIFNGIEEAIDRPRREGGHQKFIERD